MLSLRQWIWVICGIYLSGCDLIQSLEQDIKGKAQQTDQQLQGVLHNAISGIGQQGQGQQKTTQAQQQVISVEAQQLQTILQSIETVIMSRRMPASEMQMLYSSLTQTLVQITGVPGPAQQAGYISQMEVDELITSLRQIMGFIQKQSPQMSGAQINQVSQQLQAAVQQMQSLDTSVMQQATQPPTYQGRGGHGYRGMLGGIARGLSGGYNRGGYNRGGGGGYGY